MSRIVVLSDEPLLLAGLRATTCELSDLQVLFTGTVADLIRIAGDEQPDVVLLDVPDYSDLQVIRRIQAGAPAAAVVLWVRDISTEVASRAVELGARGVLRKTSGGGSVVDCLRRVAAGEMWLERSLSTALLTMKSVRLTKRESELVLLLSQGLKNKEIATELHISEGTVKVYISRLFEKVGVKDRLELALYGLRNSAWIVERMTFRVSPRVPAPSLLRVSA